MLVKQWVEVDTSRPLHLLRANDLTPATLAQLNQFVAITRSLLDRAPTEETLLPDIIDNRFRNLALDTAGQLRLLDTNQLINTHALRALAPGRHLDLTRRPIHAMVLRRLMFLDAAFRGRTCDQLTTDPVYARYLTPAGFDTLFQASAETGEPCGGTHEAATTPPRLWHHR
ncbi:hypothetical protein LIX60_30800 [Streptomyces sp. S07_1.15]|uniref:hypothetical protein n=1 Tax=Streptomyces sp. S07_1.15 TaxID=2873925 RepID=UPI001D15CEB9|nr:hypothetical protein [Streptomyces sp. S07_1.15]MCC3655772.1 hypothetical protein [Streptomyces sp. S07_1.15]